eukprot:7197306-Karenia_brevis.AAC.1
MFANLYLRAVPAMQEHVQWLTHLFMIVGIFELGTQAVRYLDSLDKLIERWHDLHERVCGVSLAGKPKAHYLYHVADSIRQFGDVLSTFAPERYHRHAKRHAVHSVGTSVAKNTLLRCCLDFLDHTEHVAFAQECFLTHPQVCSEWDTLMADRLPHVGSWMASKGIHVHQMELHKGDLLAVKVDNKTTMAVACLFLSGVQL